MNGKISGSTRLHYVKKSYGRVLKDNKHSINKAFDANKIPQDRRILFMAMAMVETTHLTSSQRDGSKDNTDSENVSLWNLSRDMVKCLGYKSDARTLNSGNEIKTVVTLLSRAIDIWNVNALLNFVRGGRRGFSDGVSYGCKDYRDTVATIYNCILNSKGLLQDDVRVEMNLYHV